MLHEYPGLSARLVIDALIAQKKKNDEALATIRKTSNVVVTTNTAPKKRAEVARAKKPVH